MEIIKTILFLIGVVQIGIIIGAFALAIGYTGRLNKLPDFFWGEKIKNFFIKILSK